MIRKKIKILVAILIAFSTVAACSSNTATDSDGRRAFAKKIQVGEMVLDRLAPFEEDDAYDWKMFFLPSAGEINLEVFIDKPKELHGVEASVYDRFGILLATEKSLVIDQETGNTKILLKVFTPEAGLHYAKISATSGRSEYSVRVKLDSREEVFVPPKTPPTFDLYVGPPSGSGDSGSGNSNSGGNANGSGEGMELTENPAGGMELPTAPVGGIVSPTPTGTTIVQTDAPSPAPSPRNGEVKTIESKGTAVTTKAEAVKPICSDLKGNYTKIEADIIIVTKKTQGTQIKLNKGKKDGVREGSVGDIYVNGKILEGGRFKVTKIFDTSLQAETNASSDDVNKASKFVIKSPEE